MTDEIKVELDDSSGDEEKPSGNECSGMYEEVTVMKTEVKEESYDFDECSEERVGLVCPFCNEEFAEEKYYEQHARYCGRREDKISLTEDIKEEKKYKCKSCKFTATFKCNLESHVLRKHSAGEKRYRCDECGHSTNIKGNLLAHMRIHVDDKPFKCDMCEFTAAQKGQLKHHTLAKHSGVEKRYKCVECGYSAHRRENLARHERVHSNERPFKCGACAFAAAQKSHLEHHVLARHSGAEKRHKCAECGYSAHRRENLARHVRVHTNERPFKCGACDFAASQKSHLDRHVTAKHTEGRKRFRCKRCDYSTDTRGDLIAHVRIHERAEGKLVIKEFIPS